MISVQVDQKQLDQLVKDLKKVGHVIASPNLQLYRANKYRKYTIDMVKRGGLDLSPLSGATKVLTGEHNPGYLTGHLVNSMGVRPVNKTTAEAGYWAKGGEKVPGKNITITKLAILQHTGYKIELDRNKGNGTPRQWLAANGIHTKKETKFLVVSPRPFMFQSYFAYMFNGEDVKAVDEFIDRLLNSPVDDLGEGIVKGMSDAGEPGRGEE